MNTINLIFPHQLFENSKLNENEFPVYLVEEHLFFNQCAFHKQKITFHRASMKKYETHLKSKDKTVRYIDATESLSDIRKLIPHLKEQGIQSIHVIDPVDDWLNKRLVKGAEEAGIVLEKHPSPMFLNSVEELETFFKPGKKKFLHNEFYIQQRKKRNILLEAEDKPIGGKWSFDAENRQKYPKDKTPPNIKLPENDPDYEEAVKYAEKQFSKNPGKPSQNPLYPTDFKAAADWFRKFLESRFKEFGPYEDALVAGQLVLHHSVLTPLLNTGLITPETVVTETLNFIEDNEIPLNSTEGFIRQIIGWREFIRGMYVFRGVEERTKNFWGFNRKIPPSFYDGSTGIDPVDITIHKVLNTGYAHHIERLMVLGNFMLLCEFDPDEVYRWFMELFIDAYDWVMVPNVYGMSQFADGGMMATKPYISGSNYLMKMSDYKKGPWQKTWDGLFWRFMHVHRDFFTQNPRLGMLVRTFDKMAPEKQKAHLDAAEAYLKQLSK
jgi:deoxyribodipyrimidine photolyase-related protein